MSVELTVEEMEAQSLAVEPLIESECSALVARIAEQTGYSVNDEDFVATVAEFAASHFRKLY